MQIVKIIAITSPNCNSRTVHLAVHVNAKKPFNYRRDGHKAGYYIEEEAERHWQYDEPH